MAMQSDLMGRRGFLVALMSSLAMPSHATTALQSKPDWSTRFDQIGTRGVVALRAPDGGIAVSDVARAQIGFLPASTFKIANALIAIDLGVVGGPDEMFQWDGEVRSLGGKPIEAWNRDQSLSEAFANSTIWVFQNVARRIGKERMAARLGELRYGNADIGKMPIDRFWLEGPLRISALQQIDFLDRLWRGNLPMSHQAIDMTKKIMLIEQGSKGTLYGKTGWAPAQNIGWFVGVIETPGGFHVFALNMDMPDVALAGHRAAIVKALAARLGLW